jgi:hypothetical protein
LRRLPVLAAADDAICKQLQQGGYILLMRHAQTVSGVGDPPVFCLDDCRTQRNLSPQGRLQARLAFGNAAVWPLLSSFFDQRDDGERQTREVLAF